MGAMDFAMQIVSGAGAVLILGAFVLLQRGVWDARRRMYLWANFLGASAMTAVAIWDQRVGFIALEGAWALVSLWGLAARRVSV
jgi:hypothetical protein